METPELKKPSNSPEIPEKNFFINNRFFFSSSHYLITYHKKQKNNFFFRLFSYKLLVLLMGKKCWYVIHRTIIKIFFIIIQTFAILYITLLYVTDPFWKSITLFSYSPIIFKKISTKTFFYIYFLAHHCLWLFLN